MNHEPRLIRVAVGDPSTSAPSPSQTQPTAAVPSPEHDVHAPLIDIHEGPDGLVLEADLPGATEKSVNVSLEDNVLSLQAEIAPTVPEGMKLLHEEYRVGSYQRSFILSDEVARDGIRAELSNGVLRVILPKAERARTRRIEIRAGE